MKGGITEFVSKFKKSDLWIFFVPLDEDFETIFTSAKIKIKIIGLCNVSVACM